MTPTYKRHCVKISDTALFCWNKIRLDLATNSGQSRYIIHRFSSLKVLISNKETSHLKSWAKQLFTRRWQLSKSARKIFGKNVSMAVGKLGDWCCTQVSAVFNISANAGALTVIFCAALHLFMQWLMTSLGLLIRKCGISFNISVKNSSVQT